jgi:hypothetical protein
MSTWHISRRRMLKGLGACIALPFLQAMVPPGKNYYSMGRRPVRFACVYMPNGVHPDEWTPIGYGENFELSKTLRPLANFKQDIIVLNELMNKGSIFPGAEGHFAKTANIMTCRPILKTLGDNINSGGISFDQLIAQQKGQDTLFDSLQYGMERVNSGICGATGFTRLYAASISWKSPTQPCTREIDPRMAFDRLFGRVVPQASPRDQRWKNSVLDAVKEDASALQRRLGRADQDKLEEYLESIRSLEKRMENEEKRKAFEDQVTPEMKKELAHLNMRIDEFKEQYVGVDPSEKFHQMLDLMTLAFQSDATRVITYMLGNAASGRNFSFLPGVRGSHHQISHHQNLPGAMEEYRKINEYYVNLLAYLLERLRCTPDIEGSLLDNSMILFISGLRDGNRHSPRNLPVIVAGKAGGKLKTGQNLLFPKDTPLANLYLSMAHVLDMKLTDFADSTGELCEIYA